MNMKSETIYIEGMSCNHCISSVTNALEATKGVTVKEVEIGKASVSYDPSTVTQQNLITAIEEIGFKVKI